MFFKNYVGLFCLMFVIFLAGRVGAARLSLKHYTSADGLASAAVFHIFRDSRGFMWFSTRDGFSRFDGRDFVNYQLPGDNPTVFNSAYETRDGTFWISASGGLYRVKPGLNGEVADSAPSQNNRYRIFNADNVSKIATSSPFFEDSRGRLWGGGTRNPLLIVENRELVLREFDLGEAARSERGAIVYAINETPDGSVWFGCEGGVLRLLPDDRRVLYPIKKETPYDETRSVIADETGRMWVGHRAGVYVFQPEPIDTLGEAADLSVRSLEVEEKAVESSSLLVPPAVSGKMLRLRFPDSPNEKENKSQQSKRKTATIDRIFRTHDGQIWMPAASNLFVYERGKIERLTDTNGFPGTIHDFAEDSANNVWIVTEGGAIKFDRAGLTTWSVADGLLEPRVHSFSAARGSGELYFIHGNWRVSRLNQDRLESARLPLPDGNRYLWTSPAALLDSTDNWWAVSSGGLYRFGAAGDIASLENQSPQIFTQKDGFRSNLFYSLFEDSRGNLWVSTRGTTAENSLGRRDAATGEWRFFGDADNFPTRTAVRAFAEDVAGNLWFGFYGGGIVRYKDGRFTDLTEAAGAPGGSVLAMHIDLKRRLWIGSTEDGLILVDNPAADNPTFKRLTTANGLSSNNVRALTSDFAGNIYVGTVRGLDRYNAETGSVRHYSTADGLASDNVTAAFRDLSGALWFGTINGLSRLVPSDGEVRKPSDLRVLINTLQIAGKERSISQFGNDAVENLNLTAAENNLQIQFLSVGDGIRYQYKLESAEEQDWSLPTTERTVNFAGFAPGTYKFFVRAVDTANRVSTNPATVSFTVAPPFWRTWQFFVSMILIAGVAVFLLDRYRVAKTRQVETALVKSQAAEKATKESETRFRTLAETASDAIITIDEESRIIFVNPAVEKIFGYQPGELIGENLTVLMPAKMRSAHAAGFGRYLTTSKKRIAWNGIELPGQHKSGAELPIEVSFGEFERDGRHYFTGIIRDISERKHAEEALQKSREARLKELQRVRTRIATDLHDDIGSSLTQIAVLTEVARGYAVRDEVKTPLERISNVSNELVDAMADIVWAINPKKDSWHELVLRMRRFASDVLSARDIEFELETLETDQNTALGANIRREVFSIFKECINNIVRHSGATEVSIEFEIIVGVLRLKIVDNGRGFDTAVVLNDDFTPEKGGNGLINIRRRVFELNGTCEIKSSGSGTSIQLLIPLQKDAEAVSLAIHVDSDGANSNGLH